MAVNEAYPLLDGEEVSWADVQITLLPKDGNAIKEFGIHEINTGEDVDIGEVKGQTGGRIVSRTTGDRKLECSLVMSRRGAQNLIRALIAKAPKRGNRAVYGRVPFDIAIFSTPLGSEEIFDRRVIGCRLQGNKLGLKEGNEHDKIELKVHALDIYDVVDGTEASLA
jgi:hypothetical protein